MVDLWVVGVMLKCFLPVCLFTVEIVFQMCHHSFVCPGFRLMWVDAVYALNYLISLLVILSINGVVDQ